MDQKESLGLDEELQAYFNFINDEKKRQLSKLIHHFFSFYYNSYFNSMFSKKIVLNLKQKNYCKLKMMKHRILKVSFQIYNFDIGRYHFLTYLEAPIKFVPQEGSQTEKDKKSDVYKQILDSEGEF